MFSKQLNKDQKLQEKSDSSIPHGNIFTYCRMEFIEIDEHIYHLDYCSPVVETKFAK